MAVRLPADTPLDELVAKAKLRWRIERDYRELKQELGPGHFEDRGWRGFHHHASLCIAAYGFLSSERETIPPQRQSAPKMARNLPFPAVLDADQTRAPRLELDHHHPPTPRRSARPQLSPMSLLRTSQPRSAKPFVTQ